MENKEIVLSVKDLKINFSTDHGYVQAVRGVSFDLYKGETLCIVGESGSGKSVTNKAIMGILSKNGRVINGSIMYEGEDLTKISEEEFHRIRGHKIGMIFQDPLSSLNPIVRIGKQITEGMLINASKTKRMYVELVSTSLTAYRNAQTELKTGLAKGTENIKFLKSEKKKHIALAKNDVSNEIGGKIYTAKQNYGAAVFELQSQEHYAIEELTVAHQKRLATLPIAKDPEKLAKYKQEFAEEKNKTANKLKELKASYLGKKAAKVLELKDSNEEKKSEITAELVKLNEQYNSDVVAVRTKFTEANIALLDRYLPRDAENAKFSYEVSKIKAKTLEKISALKVALGQEIVKINEEKGELVAKSQENVANITEKYDSLIVQAKKEYEETKPSLLAEYKPKIAEAKRKFQEDSIKAKQKVKEYKNKLKEEYLKKVLAIKGKQGKVNALKIQNELAVAKKEYISSLRITKAEAKARALEVMTEVGIKDPEKRFRQFPFEFSGGMRQRIVIAIALTANPDILICDEPTTALDVTIQAQILELINKLKKERNLSCIFITHDLGVVANMADRVAVMYAGKIVEYGTEREIFYDPKHPYTWALLSSIPDVDSNEKLDAIPGTPPNMIYPPVGDAFALRSKYALEIDFKKEPPYFKVSDTHYAATWLLDPRAPKVEMPKIVKSRIENSLKAHEKGGNQ